MNDQNITPMPFQCPRKETRKSGHHHVVIMVALWVAYVEPYCVALCKSNSTITQIRHTYKGSSVTAESQQAIAIHTVICLFGH